MKYKDILLHKNKKLAYLVILRNGSRTCRDYLLQEDFEHITNYRTINPHAKLLEESDLSQVENYFCNIRHPKERIIRGIAAAICSSSTLAEQFLTFDINSKSKVINGYFESNPLAWLKIFHDWHIYPVSYHYEEYLDKLFPLPISDEYDLDSTIGLYLRNKGIKIKTIQQRNPSGKNIHIAQKKLRQIINSEPGNMFYEEFLLPWYKKDLDLYKESVYNMEKMLSET